MVMIVLSKILYVAINYPYRLYLSITLIFSIILIVFEFTINVISLVLVTGGWGGGVFDSLDDTINRF